MLETRLGLLLHQIWEQAIWFTEKKDWIVGEKCDLGSEKGSIFCKECDVKSPIMAEKIWTYAPLQRISRPGDITFTKIEGKNQHNDKVGERV